MDTVLNVLLPGLIKGLTALFALGTCGALIALLFTLADNVRTFLFATRPERSIDGVADRGVNSPLRET